MKNQLIALAILTATTQVNATELTSYNDFTQALAQGDRFVIYTNFGLCAGSPTGPTNAAQTSFVPNAVAYIPGASGNIQLSDLHFTDYPAGPNDEYIKFTFTPDQTVVISTTIYNPQTFAPMSSPIQFSCQLGQGVQVFGSQTL